MKSEILRRISLHSIKDEIEQTNNPKKKKEVNGEVDYIEQTMGAFGVWQALTVAAVTLTRFIAVWNMMAIAFLTPNTEFICVEFSGNITVAVEKFTCYDNCLRYNYTSITGKTIIEDFSLICQNAWLASFAQSILMFGLLLGVSLFGWISDRFGRRIALISSTLINAIFMVALPFSPNYIIFSSIRFIIGVASGGSLIICVVHVVEVIGKKYREIGGALAILPDGIAEAGLGIFAYFTSTWQSFTMICGIGTCIILVPILFVPESPRWLVANGRTDEAIEVITRAAVRNKLDTSNIKDIITKAVKSIELQEKEAVKTTYLDFFNSKQMSLHTVVVFIMWLICGVCFYGIYQFMTLISVNPYLTIIIAGFIQVPLCPLAIVINRNFGRKVSTIFLTCFAGITMIALIFIPEAHWLGTVMSVIGFSAGSMCFGIMYVYVSELYPTPLRNMAYGLSSGGAKIGAMIAPFVANLHPRWMPSLIFGVVPFIAGLCCLALPETRGQNLKDTVEK